MHSKIKLSLVLLVTFLSLSNITLSSSLPFTAVSDYEIAPLNDRDLTYEI